MKVCALLVVCLLSADGTIIFARAAERTAQRPPAAVTFTKQIAPLIFNRCAQCHRPGQSAPFSLLTYVDVQKRAKQIAEVTLKCYMPPWLPVRGYGDLANDWSLSEEQIAAIQQWVAEGSPEGDPRDMPALPRWTEGWQLGQPALIVKLPQPFLLSPEGQAGKDVYRNFVVPIPSAARRYVKGVEFLPDNPKVVHHAFILLDRTRVSRNLADKENPPGFSGMATPQTAIMPAGQFLGWRPGVAPVFASRGMGFVLDPNTDLVLQLHLHPTGKAEVVQPSVGFFFTDEAPTHAAFRINLPCLLIDIPPGATNYMVEQKYVLPVDVDVLAVSPHAHYLGKEMQGYAVLPDGSKKWLLYIKQWDFNWQSDYRYAKPVFLPKGTTLTMRFSYDNSTNNIRNPSQPPKRVKYGLQTTDEMGELWFQVMPRNEADQQTLRSDFFKQLARYTIEYNRHLAEIDPNDAVALTKLGRALFALGNVSEALRHLQAAIQAKPDYDKAHYELGYLYLNQEKLEDAEREFTTVLRLNPEDYQAHGNLGNICLRQRKLDQALSHFEAALKINPNDEIARKNRNLILQTVPRRR